MTDAVKTTLKTKYGGSLENSIRANKLLLSKFCQDIHNMKLWRG